MARCSTPAPARIGGTSDIPIESIRLKLIREGLEDYEYLYLCSRLGLAELAGKQQQDALLPTFTSGTTGRRLCMRSGARWATPSVRTYASGVALTGSEEKQQITSGQIDSLSTSASESLPVGQSLSFATFVHHRGCP